LRKDRGGALREKKSKDEKRSGCGGLGMEKGAGPYGKVSEKFDISLILRKRGRRNVEGSARF